MHHLRLSNSQKSQAASRKTRPSQINQRNAPPSGGNGFIPFLLGFFDGLVDFSISKLAKCLSFEPYRFIKIVVEVMFHG